MRVQDDPRHMQIIRQHQRIEELEAALAAARARICELEGVAGRTSVTGPYRTSSGTDTQEV